MQLRQGEKPALEFFQATRSSIAGSASAKVAQRGVAPMAAMSDKLTAVFYVLTEMDQHRQEVRTTGHMRVDGHINGVLGTGTCKRGVNSPGWPTSSGWFLVSVEFDLIRRLLPPVSATGLLACWIE